MWTKYHQSYLTDGCWSPVRPGLPQSLKCNHKLTAIYLGVFFTAKTDGSLDIWDLLLKQSDAALTVQVSESALQSVRVQEHGAYVSCGAKDGSVTLIELGNTLARLQPNEKPSISAVCHTCNHCCSHLTHSCRCLSASWPVRRHCCRACVKSRSKSV